MLKRLLYTLTFMTLLLGCNLKKGQNNGKSINVSIEPQKYFAERLLPEGYQINVVVKSGYNPESYEPTMNQMSQLENANLYLQVCKEGFDETWVQKLKKLNPEMKIVDLSDGMNLIMENSHHQDHSHNNIDPHIWVSPSTTIQMVQNMGASLIEQFPDDSSQIRDSYEELIRELRSTDSLYHNKLEPYKDEKFIVYHPVYSYIARDYHLQQICIEQDGKEPSVKQLARLIDEAKSKNITLIFIQKEFDAKNAELLASETGSMVVSINPLNANWFEESKSVLNYLVESFEKKN